MMKYFGKTILCLLMLCNYSQAEQLLAKPEIPMPENVVLILADDIGAEWFGAYGSVTQKTPRIDHLAERGYVFDNFNALPLCSPSRQTILTGTHQYRRHEFDWTMPGDTKTFLQILDAEGYKIGAFGKWDGFDKETAFNEFKVDSYTIYNKGDRRFWNPQTVENGVIKNYEESDYGPDIYNAHLLNFISANKDEKFFAYYMMALGHWPFVPTPDSQNKAETDWQKNFVDMVDYTDKLVGRVMDHLNMLGLSDKTLVIFTADNGTYPELISELANGDIVIGGKSYPVQTGHRVPFIAYYGRHFQHKRIDTMADFKDIFPTIMDVAGVNDLPTGYQLSDGESLMPLLLTDNPRTKKYSVSYFEAVEGRNDMRALHVRNKNWKLYSDGRLVDLSNDADEYDFTTGLNENALQVAARRELRAELDRLYISDADYRTVADLLVRENGRVIGNWSPSELSFSRTHTINIDITHLIDDAKSYMFSAQHFKGDGGVSVSGLCLLNNGEVVAKDEHLSHSRKYMETEYIYYNEQTNAYYDLSLEDPIQEGDKYELQVSVRQTQSGDSYGLIRFHESGTEIP